MIKDSIVEALEGSDALLGDGYVNELLKVFNQEVLSELEKVQQWKNDKLRNDYLTSRIKELNKKLPWTERSWD